MTTINVNKGGIVKVENKDGDIVAIVDRIKRRRLTKKSDGSLVTVSQAEKDEKNNVTKSVNHAIKDEKNESTNSKLINPVTKVSDLTKQLKLADTGVDTNKKFELQNFGTSESSTNFPRNTPVYINGPKGSGKTFLLSALLQYVFKHELVRRLFYIYAENVDTTISRAVPKDKLYQVPKAQALGIMVKYLAKKSKLCACSNFVISYLHFDGKNNFYMMSRDELMGTNVYWDTMLEDISTRKRLLSAAEIYEYCKRIVKKYSTPTTIKVGNIELNVGDITSNDFDMFVIDDIAQFYDLWGTTRTKSPIYKYFTITRQNMTTFYLAGQELGQLPKMFREQLGAVVVMYGSDIDDLAKYKFNKRLRDEVEEKFSTMSNHDGILYNYNTRTMETIRS